MNGEPKQLREFRGNNNMNQSKESDDQISASRAATVRRYIEAWAEKSPEKIQEILEEVWTPTSTYEDPLTAELTGYDGVIGHIRKFQELRPDARIELNSLVDQYHQMGRFHWILIMPDGTVSYGTDFVEFDENNRLSRVIGFPSHLDRRQK